jgi:RNA polymerase sigma-70 factor (ECF subfamily)
MADAQVFSTHRPLLFSIAYRMLGSASDAEDILQDAWLRYTSHDGEVHTPKAFAATIVTRLCLDRLKSAQATREEYVGPWLPEPVLTSDTENPDTMLQRSESVTLAFLVLLETLSPEERAVFLLKEVFEYDHSEIAKMLGTSAANSRQLLHRARARVADARPSATAPAAPRQLAERFAKALHQGDARELTALLAHDVSLVSDGGGKVAAARRPLEGRDEVLNFLVGLHRVAITTGIGRQAALSTAEVNGEAAMVMRINGRLDAVYVMSFEGDAIAAIRIVRNPDKLAYVDGQLRHQGRA